MSRHDDPLIEKLDRFIDLLELTGQTISVTKYDDVTVIKLAFLVKADAKTLGRHLRTCGLEEITLRQCKGRGDWEMTADWPHSKSEEIILKR